MCVSARPLPPLTCKLPARVVVSSRRRHLRRPVKLAPGAVVDGGNAAGQQCCLVCLEVFEEGQNVRLLPCFHQFHKDCVGKWLSIKADCPVCKVSIRQ
jgi:hypothetical protein